MERRQGVITKKFEHDDKVFFEIFDNKLHYIFTDIEKPLYFATEGTWVEYGVKETTEMGYRFKAEDPSEKDLEHSQSPANIEFSQENKMDVNGNKIDYFFYDNQSLKFKCTVKLGEKGWYNEYYGLVSIDPDSHKTLTTNGISEMDVVLELSKEIDYTECPKWTILFYVNRGTMYSINGYLSNIGILRRGPKGKVMKRSQVHVAPHDMVIVENNTSASTFGSARNGMDEWMGRRRNEELDGRRSEIVVIEEEKDYHGEGTSGRNTDYLEKQVRKINYFSSNAAADEPSTSGGQSGGGLAHLSKKSFKK